MSADHPKGSLGLKVLTYAPGSEANLDKLEKALSMLAPHHRLESMRGVAALGKRLSRPLYDVDAVILLAGNPPELESLLKWREILTSLPVILILPDSRHDMVAQAHKLCPRFVTYHDSDPLDLLMVLGRILERQESKRKLERRRLPDTQLEPADSQA
jgi:hypothetical protein